jgi:tetratricopeptide (TPR) repeat protein
MGRILAVVLLVAASTAAAGGDENEDRARQLYRDGKSAFDARRYQDAYARFKEAYLLSARAELLFDMSRALEDLGRPREAADTLRAYLRVVPRDTERPALEQKIRALDEKQRLLDADLKAPRSSVTPIASTDAHANVPRSRTGLVVGLSVAGAAVAALAIGLGVGLGTPPAHTQSSLGAWQATR